MSRESHQYEKAIYVIETPKAGSWYQQNKPAIIIVSIVFIAVYAVAHFHP